jgi:hypothetical protein
MREREREREMEREREREREKKKEREREREKEREAKCAAVNGICAQLRPQKTRCQCRVCAKRNMMYSQTKHCSFWWGSS